MQVVYMNLTVVVVNVFHAHVNYNLLSMFSNRNILNPYKDSDRHYFVLLTYLVHFFAMLYYD